MKKARLLLELGRIALSSIAHYFDPVTGAVHHPSDLELDAAGALASFEVVIKNAKAGDSASDVMLESD